MTQQRMDTKYPADLAEKAIEMLQELARRIERILPTREAARTDSRGEPDSRQDALD